MIFCSSMGANAADSCEGRGVLRPAVANSMVELHGEKQEPLQKWLLSSSQTVAKN